MLASWSTYFHRSLVVYFAVVSIECPPGLHDVLGFPLDGVAAYFSCMSTVDAAGLAGWLRELAARQALSQQLWSTFTA